MMEKNETEVKDVDIKYIEPTKDDELIDEEKDTQPESSAGEKPGEEKEEQKDTLLGRALDSKEVKPVEGETPVERARRLEIERLRKVIRDSKRKELFEDEKQPVTQKVVSDEKKKILEKYNPDDVKALGEVLDVYADELGFARKADIQATTYDQVANDALDTFLDRHPEYSPENDKENVLWDRFKEEIKLYRKPENPRDYKKVFEKIHKDIFGIESSDTLSKINAQKEKLRVASHSGATPGSAAPVPRGTSLDTSLKQKLKGFSEAELKELFGE